MQWVPVTEADIPVSTRPNSRSAQLFEAFLNSEDDVWRIDLNEKDDKPAESVRSGLDNYVTRHDLPVVVFTRSSQLFIQKSDTKPSQRPKKTRKPRTPKVETNGNSVVEETSDVEGTEQADNAAEYAGV